MFFLLFGLFVPFVMLLVFAQLVYVLAVTLGPVLLVLFVCWVVYRLVRRRG